MKKTFITLLVTLMVTAAFAQNSDSTATTMNNGYVTDFRPAKSSSNYSTGICKDLTGVIIGLRGSAPYIKQPYENDYWPRFSVQGSAGYLYKFFVVEGVLEYMQVNYNYPSQPTNYYNYLLSSARLGAMLPIQLGSKVLLIPNVKGVFGGCFYFGSGFTSSFMAGVSGGLDFGFRLGGKAMFSLGYVYEYRWYINGSRTNGIDMMGGQLSVAF